MQVRFLYLAVLATALVSGCGADKVEQADEPELRSGVDLEALDRSTRPQDDFYQFVNGGWLDTTEIPSIYSGYTVYHEVNERVEEALRSIIELAAAESGPEGSESQQVGDIYSSWMDVEAINAAGEEGQAGRGDRGLSRSDPAAPRVRSRLLQPRRGPAREGPESGRPRDRRGGCRRLP